MTTTTLEHTVERSVLICARRSTVFRFFTDSALFAQWWGEGSKIDGRPGGAVTIRYPNGITASGVVKEIVKGEHIAFTYGYDAPGKPIPPGGSFVTITLEDRPDGTLLKLRHEVADAATREAHVQGWRYQLALFANVASRLQHADLAATVDRYFDLWSEPDPSRRREAIGLLCAEDIVFRDAHGCTSGRAELAAHIAAAQMYMPGIRLRREGDVRQCQGTALADWIAQGGPGPSGRGTNVFDLSPEGQIARVVGL